MPTEYNGTSRFSRFLLKQFICKRLFGHKEAVTFLQHLGCSRSRSSRRQAGKPGDAQDRQGRVESRPSQHGKLGLSETRSYPRMWTRVDKNCEDKHDFFVCAEHTGIQEPRGRAPVTRVTFPLRREELKTGLESKEGKLPIFPTFLPIRKSEVTLLISFIRSVPRLLTFSRSSFME